MSRSYACAVCIRCQITQTASSQQQHVGPYILQKCTRLYSVLSQLRCRLGDNTKHAHAHALKFQHQANAVYRSRQKRSYQLGGSLHAQARPVTPVQRVGVQLGCLVGTQVAAGITTQLTPSVPCMWSFCIMPENKPPTADHILCKARPVSAPVHAKGFDCERLGIVGECTPSVSMRWL